MAAPSQPTPEPEPRISKPHSNSSACDTGVSGASLPSSTETKGVGSKGRRIDRWGMIVEDTAGDQQHDDSQLERWRSNVDSLSKTLLDRDVQRELKWVTMSQNWSQFCRRNPTVVKRRVRKGIPDSLRASVWPRLCGADTQKLKNPQVYANLRERKALAEVEIQIKKDKKRTLQHHVLFRSEQPDNPDLDADQGLGQSVLFNILKAYSLYDHRVGYCQGMSSAAAMFATYMPEEDAFWMLERVLNSDKYYNFGGVYEPGFPLLFKFLFIHEKLMHRHCKSVKTHFENNGIMTTMYATRWYSTLFSQFPPQVVVRVWDIFLHEGVKILFRLAIALLVKFKRKLTQGDMEHALVTLQDLPTNPWVQNADEVIQAALSISISRKDLVKYEKMFLAHDAASSRQ